MNEKQLLAGFVPTENFKRASRALMRVESTPNDVMDHVRELYLNGAAQEAFRYCGSSRTTWETRGTQTGRWSGNTRFITERAKAEPLPEPKRKVRFIPKLLSGGWRLVGHVFCNRNLPDSWRPVPRTVMSAWGSL